MSIRSDQRTLYDKLMELSVNKGATEPERKLAREKANAIKLRAAMDRAEKDHNRTAIENDVYEFMNMQRRKANAAWVFRPEKGDRPRSKRQPKSFHTHYMREAQARAKYNAELQEQFFGLKDHPDIVKARTKFNEFVGTPIRHVNLINGKITKLFLFWNFGASRDITWYFIERDTVTQKTMKSKRYFTREAAMEAFHSESITWQHTEYI